MQHFAENAEQGKMLALAAYRLKPNFSKAAEAAGVNRRTVWRWMKTDPEFRADMRDALEALTDEIEEKLADRAKGDGKDAVFAATVWLNTHRRHIYKPETVHEKIGAGPITINVNVAIDPSRQPRRLPVQAGDEISLPSGEADADD